MLEIRPLDTISIDSLVDTFLEAFSDYATTFSRQQVLSNLNRRGFKAEYSYGMFDNDRLVSFVFNGIRNYNGRFTAYDTGTGTLKDYRQKGLTSRLLQHAESALKEKGIGGYLLEVLCDNAPAVALYEKTGFATVREYTCHTQSAGKISLPELSTPGTEAAVVPVSAVADTYNHFCDTPPSWQNSTQSILAAGAGIVRFAATIAGDTVGYIAGDPALGDIMAFVVRPDMRGKGIGTALLKTFLSANQADIVKILNVDTRCHTLHTYLTRRNLPVYVRQYEMYKPFQ